MGVFTLTLRIIISSPGYISITLAIVHFALCNPQWEPRLRSGVVFPFVFHFTFIVRLGKHSLMNRLQNDYTVDLVYSYLSLKHADSSNGSFVVSRNARPHMKWFVVRYLKSSGLSEKETRGLEEGCVCGGCIDKIWVSMCVRLCLSHHFLIGK